MGRVYQPVVWFTVLAQVDRRPFEADDPRLGRSHPVDIRNNSQGRAFGAARAFGSRAQYDTRGGAAHRGRRSTHPAPAGLARAERALCAAGELSHFRAACTAHTSAHALCAHHAQPRQAALGDFCTVKCELYRAEPGFLLQAWLYSLWVWLY